MSSIEPTDPIVTSLLICERTLTEADGVTSAIRIVDVHYVQPDPDVPPEKRPINISVHFMAKFPAGDESDHSVAVRIERPDGEVIDIATSEPAHPSRDKFVGLPQGISVILRFGVFPKVLGTHFIVVVLDGKHTVRAPFTLLALPGAPDRNSQQH